MRKLKSEDKEYSLKRFCCLGLFFCTVLFFSSIAEAEEVKYFGRLYCGIFKFDDYCKFGQELDSKDLAKFWGYYEVHYKDGKLANAVRINKEKLDEEPPSVSEKLEFDRNGRLIYQETNLHEHSQYDPILYKRSYTKESYELRYFDKTGKLIARESHEYENNLLVKRLAYDESGKLISYSTFDHDTLIEKVFTPDHKLRYEIDMRRYFD